MNFVDFKFRDRNFLPGKFYHLYNVGFSKMKIFKSDEDCYRFIDRMSFYLKLFKVKLRNYSLMENHFHFLAEGGDIGKFMHSFEQSYATYFNIKYGRRGHVFNGRFNSIAVTKEEYFRELQKYISANPIKFMKNMPEGTEINSSVHQSFQSRSAGERSLNVH